MSQELATRLHFYALFNFKKELFQNIKFSAKSAKKAFFRFSYFGGPPTRGYPCWANLCLFREPIGANCVSTMLFYLKKIINNNKIRNQVQKCRFSRDGVILGPKSRKPGMSNFQPFSPFLGPKWIKMRR